MKDYFDTYLDYVAETEAPIVYHRWSSISMLATLLERDVHLKLGHFEIYPNMYIMLIGAAASRKSTSIKIAKKALKGSGFDKFAADETSREQFLIDLHEVSHRDCDDSNLDEILFGDVGTEEYAASLPSGVCYVAADEFNEFIGLGNTRFISTLGTLWDYIGVFDKKLKNSKRVLINNPTINILGGNTPTGFASAFPPEIIGQGFFSRQLLIYGQPTGIKIPFPAAPSDEAIQAMAKMITEIKVTVRGVMEVTPNGKLLLQDIYTSWKPLEDVRFTNYSGRRFTHLLKLCIVVSASKLELVIDSSSIVLANTLLSLAETKMPKALGEFGTGRNSAVSNKVLELIDSSRVPVGITQVIRAIHSDIDNLSAVSDILKGLEIAGKIQCVEGKFLPKIATPVNYKAGHVDVNLLHPLEINES